MADGVTMSDVYAEYRVKFDTLNKEVADRRAAASVVQSELDVVNAEVERLQIRQRQLADKKSNLLGGQSYLDLKKHLAALAKLLSGKKLSNN